MLPKPPQNRSRTPQIQNHQTNTIHSTRRIPRPTHRQLQRSNVHIPQTLKETGARPGEALKLEWDDIDIEGKKSTSRIQKKAATQEYAQYQLSCLTNATRTAQKTELNLQLQNQKLRWQNLQEMRQRAIHKLGNPELRKIDFYTFRYWRATMEYRRLHDFGAVMVLLGHKSPQVRATLCATKRKLRHATTDTSAKKPEHAKKQNN